MRLAYLPANQSWIVLFGDRICGVGPDNRAVFASKAEAEDILRECGLRLAGRRIVVDDTRTPKNLQATS